MARHILCMVFKWSKNGSSYCHSVWLSGGINLKNVINVILSDWHWDIIDTKTSWCLWWAHFLVHCAYLSDKCEWYWQRQRFKNATISNVSEVILQTLWNILHYSKKKARDYKTVYSQWTFEATPVVILVGDTITATIPMSTRHRPNVNPIIVM